ncbi:F-box/LRR-repeat protein, partial [Trifolium medium]|nr:F-box/LRR-repeat protein [Trifolium medium]
MYRSVQYLFFADQTDPYSSSPEKDNSGSEMININDLPEEIITHILSFLPFKHAVRTIILSQRWRLLFHSLAVLNIDDERTCSKEYWYGFRQFMDKNMFPPHSQHITLKSFHLKCDHKLWDARADSSSLNNWIIAAKQRGIEYLNLSYYDVLLVPTTLFCCKTLVVLKLEYMPVVQMKNRCSVDLPSLKTLDLYNVCFHNMKNLMRLISGCPILENLKTYVKAKGGVRVGGYFKPLSKLIKADIHLFEVPLKAVCNVQFLSIGQ